MKKISFFSLRLMLAVVFCCFGFRAMADEATLYDGTVTNSYVPVYGSWADAYQRTQCLYSADDLAAAGIEPGATINSLTYYLYSPADEAWTSLWDVKVVETTATSLSSGYVSLSGATEVLTGATWSATKSTFTIQFATPYVYEGGNLVIDIQNQEGGNYSNAVFYGANVTGASRNGYNSNGTAYISGSTYSFAPKTTFDFTPATTSCPRPDNLVVDDITAYSAHISWEGTAPSYELTVNGVSTIETATEKQLTLAPFTRYNVSVRAICAEGDTSTVRSIAFLTEKTCLAPDTVYFTEPTLEGNTTLTWSGDASMYYLLVSDGGNLLYNDRIGANSFDITGLSAGVHHLIVYLSAQCGAHAHEQSDTLNLNLTIDIPCLPAQLPWSEGFENMPRGNNTSDAPSCWASINVNEGNYPYAFINGNSGYVHTGYQSLYFQSSSTTDAFMLLPEFEADLTGVEVSFWYRNEGTSDSNGMLGLGYFTDSSDESTFVLVAECERSVAFEQAFITLPQIPAGARLAFRCAHGTAQNYYAAIDDIEILPAGSCAKVQNIRLGEVGQTDAAVLWSPVEGASGYNVLVVSGTDTLANQTVQDTVFTLQNLYPSSSYSLTVSVSTVCSATDMSAAQTKVLTFATACGPIAVLPWTEDFESMPLGNNSAPAPACWDFVNVNEGTYPYVFVNNSSSYVHSGSRSLYFQSSNSKYAYVFLPEFGVNLSNAEISFWYKDESSSSSGYLDLGYMREDVFTSIASYPRSTSWTAAATMLSELPEGERLCFRYGGASNNYYLGIDDIVIRNLSSCPSVEDIFMVSASLDSVVIAWPAVEGAQEYNVNLLNGAAPVVVTDTFFVINDLQGGPVYSIPVSVSVVCKDGALSDAFQKTLSFVAAPWKEDFENYASNTLPTGWDNSASTSSSISDYPYYLWGVYNTAGNNLMRMNNYSARAGETSTLSPLVILPADASSFLMFDYAHNSNGGNMIVSISEDNGQSFTVLGSYAKGSASSNTIPGDLTPVSIDLASYAGKAVILKFEAYCNYGSGAIFVDNIYVGVPPTCFPVQEIHLVDGSITTDAAAIAWTPAEEGGDNFLVTVVNAADTLYNGLVNDTVLALTELVPATTYDLSVSVQTVCAEDDAANKLTANFVFVTNCVVLEAPYFTSFEEGNACWNLDGGISVASTYSYSYEGAYALKFATTNEVYAVLPELENLNGNRFTMFYRNEGDGYNTTSGYFLMGYMVDNEFVQLSDSFPQVFQMTEAFVDFADVPAGARAAIKYYGATSSGWYGYVDNVEVAPIPTCFPASNLRVDTVGTDFVTLVWSLAASEMGYNIVVSQWGDTLANAYVRDTVFTVTGLRHSYPYYNVLVDITSVCGEDDLAKTYSSSIHFTTECGVNEIDYYNPFSAWFDGTDLNSNCFHTYGTGNSQGWQSGKGEVVLGDYSSYYYATVPYATDTVRVTSVLELPRIGLRAGKQYELSFWAKGTDYLTEDTIAVYANDELIMAANAQEIGGAWVHIVDTIAGEGEYLISIRYSSFFGYSFSIDDIAIREIYQFEASTFEDLQVDENGLFRPYKHSGWNNWDSGSQTFVTFVDDTYGAPYYSDVTVSSLKDTTFTNDYSAGYDMKSACGTAAEGNQYAVWFNNWYSEGISVSLRKPEVLSGMYVTNNTYLVNSILNGDSYAKKFTTGDWFKLTVNGFIYADNDGDGRWESEKVGSVDFYLADFRNPMDYKYASDWMWLDLTSLGEVTNLGFELTSSDNGDFGMNTPAYFCFDNLGGVAPAQSADYRHIINLPENLWIIGECATANWNPSASMQMTKVADGVFEVIETLTGTWFAFSGSNSSNWNEVNALRFGANPSGATVTLGQAEAITGVAGDYCFTVPAAGTYKFVVDLNAMTVTVTAVTALDNVDTDNVAEKFFRDNQVLIRKNGKTHNVLGQQVR